MEILVSKINEELQKLNKLIDDYEDNYFNFYETEIKELSLCWHNGYSKIFITNAKKEKEIENTTIVELRKIINIYNSLVEKYNNIGCKIVFNLKNKDKMLIKLNNYINEINTNINLYNNLELSNWNNASVYLKNEKITLSNMEIKAKEVRDNLQERLNSIEEYEKTIASKITKIDIETIKVTDISYLNSKVVDMEIKDAFILVDDLNLCKNKIELYTNTENIIFFKILTSLNTINYCYKTSNKAKLVNLYDQLYNKLNVIKKIHNNNIDIITKHISECSKEI